VDVDPGRLRIALQTEAFNGSPVHPDCVEAARDAAKLCESLGHHVEEAKVPFDAEALGRATGVIISGNLRASVLARAAELGREATPDDIETATWRMMQGAAASSASDFVAATRTIHRAGRQVARFMESYDVILTPTMASPPAKIGQLSLDNTDDSFREGLSAAVGFTSLFNAAGNPAMSVPLHWNAAGLPIGVQFAGRYGDEATLFRLAAQLEQAHPWFARRP
jgi:Asp-tRNA(Asn)/Glu-tRNA(Gln) amidotransferase A subunit family amidase